MTTVAELLRGLDGVVPAHEARWLVEAAIGAPPVGAVLTEEVTERMVHHLDAMVGRLRAGEPLQYVTGSWSFRRLDLAVPQYKHLRHRLILFPCQIRHSPPSLSELDPQRRRLGLDHRLEGHALGVGVRLDRRRRPRRFSSLGSRWTIFATAPRSIASACPCKRR
jgi:hypothetical protein